MPKQRILAAVGTALLLGSGLTAVIASSGGSAFAAGQPPTMSQLRSGAQSAADAQSGPNVQSGLNVQSGPNVQGGPPDATLSHPAHVEADGN